MDREAPRKTGQVEEGKGVFTGEFEGISWYYFIQDNPITGWKEAEGMRKEEGRGVASNKL